VAPAEDRNGGPGGGAANRAVQPRTIVAGTGKAHVWCHQIFIDIRAEQVRADFAGGTDIESIRHVEVDAPGLEPSDVRKRIDDEALLREPQRIVSIAMDVIAE
jgi:hypothetical protein